MPRYLLPVLCGLLAAPTAASAADLPYLDDRSTPAALVKSLYNAINRQEYARALAYFDERPAETIEQFADTFGDTERISVVTGNPLREEDEGQPDRFQVPLAVEFEREDGQTRVLAGCYTILGQSGSSEEDAFRPYRIESGLVDPVDVPFDEALPGRCGDGPELPDRGALRQQQHGEREAGRGFLDRARCRGPLLARCGGVELDLHEPANTPGPGRSPAAPATPRSA
jgi:hypothetical protein